MFWKKLVKDYLSFSRRDRIGLFVIVGAISGSIFIPRLFARQAKAEALADSPALAKAIDTLDKLSAEKKFDRSANASYGDNTDLYEPVHKSAFSNGELFRFDPNTISAAEWQRLGLNEKTSRTIEKYVSKGGRFYKPDDLMKIWGMPEGFYQRVKDYISITASPKNYTAYESKPNFVREEKKLIAVSINEADTSAFIALQGIGSKLSARIIAFREKLGGFYSVDQIGETYGLPDSTFQKIKSHLLLNGHTKKINVNTATKEDLKGHPYIKWNLANAIVEYRARHGAYKSLEELKNIVLIDEKAFDKIVHYLSL